MPGDAFADLPGAPHSGESGFMEDEQVGSTDASKAEMDLKSVRDQAATVSKELVTLCTEMRLLRQDLDAEISGRTVAEDHLVQQLGLMYDSVQQFVSNSGAAKAPSCEMDVGQVGSLAEGLQRLERELLSERAARTEEGVRITLNETRVTELWEAFQRRMTLLESHAEKKSQEVVQLATALKGFAERVKSDLEQCERGAAAHCQQLSLDLEAEKREHSMKFDELHSIFQQAREAFHVLEREGQRDRCHNSSCSAAETQTPPQSFIESTPCKEILVQSSASGRNNDSLDMPLSSVGSPLDKPALDSLCRNLQLDEEADVPRTEYIAQDVHEMSQVHLISALTGVRQQRFAEPSAEKAAGLRSATEEQGSTLAHSVETMLAMATSCNRRIAQLENDECERRVCVDKLQREVAEQRAPIVEIARVLRIVADEIENRGEESQHSPLDTDAIKIKNLRQVVEARCGLQNASDPDSAGCNGTIEMMDPQVQVHIASLLDLCKERFDQLESGKDEIISALQATKFDVDDVRLSLAELLRVQLHEQRQSLIEAMRMQAPVTDEASSAHAREGLENELSQGSSVMLDRMPRLEERIGEQVSGCYSREPRANEPCHEGQREQPNMCDFLALREALDKEVLVREKDNAHLSGMLQQLQAHLESDVDPQLISIGEKLKQLPGTMALQSKAHEEFIFERDKNKSLDVHDQCTIRTEFKKIAEALDADKERWTQEIHEISLKVDSLQTRVETECKSEANVKDLASLWTQVEPIVRASADISSALREEFATDFDRCAADPDRAELFRRVHELAGQLHEQQPASSSSHQRVDGQKEHLNDASLSNQVTNAAVPPQGARSRSEDPVVDDATASQMPRSNLAKHAAHSSEKFNVLSQAIDLEIQCLRQDFMHHVQDVRDDLNETQKELKVQVDELWSGLQAEQRRGAAIAQRVAQLTCDPR